ncbi:uncharacterized protein LOC131071300 [Cryptomeria japonica]|uniref:uncharacterized protein LOC131071300 n=1 Tax=Cryptomeria japonica TaxID=3369 RepID=UPI0027D9F646|nr:uncharacterized protein LOC131071300 [Cryptomeria japonica]
MGFRDIKVIEEEEEEFMKENTSQLPVNKIEGSYGSVEEYLETHFRLIREDLITPYRQAVRELRRRKSCNFNCKSLTDIQIYNSVKMVGMRAENSGMEYVLKFSGIEGHNYVDWANGKLLMYNSLLCISGDEFETFFWAVVSSRRPRDLHVENKIGVRGIDKLEAKFEYGVEYVMFESTSAFFEAYQHVLKVLQRKEMEKLVFLRHLVFVETEVGVPGYLVSSSGSGGGTGWVGEVENLAAGGSEMAANGWGEELMSIKNEGNDTDWAAGSNGTAVQGIDTVWGPWTNGSASDSGWGREETSVINEGTARGWEALINEIAGDDGWEGESASSARELMGTDQDGQSEKQAAGGNVRANDGWGGELDSIITEGTDTGCGVDAENCVWGNEDADWDHGQEANLAEGNGPHSEPELPGFLTADIDDSQEAAIRHGLSKKLAIIQGPAGTGKTFVGLFITEQLLASMKLNGPIIVVCYTNRALDQFLEGIYKYETSLVRLGTGSKSQVLQQCSLERFQRKFRIRLPKILGRAKVRLRCIQEEMTDKLNFHAKCMYAEHVTRKALVRVAKEEHMDSLFFCNYCPEDDIYQSWLVGNDKVHPTACLHSVVESKIENTTQNQSLKFEDIEDDPVSIGLFLEYGKIEDVWKLDALSRKKLDGYWLNQIKLHGQKAFWNLAPEYESLINEMVKTKSKIQQYVLRSAKILGMTTTVAARFFDILYSIKPQVMIVEEAAEVLEGQLLACLNPHIEHLILIGDHLQLRPSVASSQLALNYNFDVSLFERLVTNGIEYKTLQVQRRMRPAIAYLLTGFYPTVRDHRCVQTLDNVKGVLSNVYFLDHSNVESCMDISGSKFNHGEADLVVEFSLYLMNNCGYSSRDITILSMYRSQANEISQRFLQYFSRKKRVRDKDHMGDAPMVRSVDEFQGEESNIVILSLVIELEANGK